MSETFDVIVVGAGPAGAISALLAARAGRSVLLVDRATFPRTKVCGCCLNPAGLAVLDRLGLGSLVGELGAVPLRHIRINAGGPTATLPLDGVALSRSAFDLALIDAARSAGVIVRTGVTARLGAVEGDARIVELPEPIQGHLVIAADGLGGQFLQRAGLDNARPHTDSHIGASVILDGHADYDPGSVYMACGRSGYLGLVRLEDGRLDLACALSPSAVARGHGPGTVASELLEGVGWPIPDGIVEAGWKGTPRLTRQATTPGAERVLAVGDAAGYVEPFTGQGMTWAMAGAEALVPLLAEGWRADTLARWTQAHRQRVRSGQSLCGWLAAALRRPWLMALTTRLLYLWPGLAGPFLRQLHHTGKGIA